MPRSDHAPSRSWRRSATKFCSACSSCATRLPSRAKRNRRSRSAETGRHRRGRSYVLQLFPAFKPQHQESQMPTATAASKTAAPKPVPVPNGDFYQLIELLTPEEKAVVKKVRTYMETKVQPIINKYWSDDAFPFELLPSFKELGIGGLGFEGYGCPGGSQKLFGFVAMEMARVDASFGTFFGVHSGLAMGSIYLDGSEEQKQKWLPPMARGEKIGCFGLTEPLVGSGTSGGMTPTAKREGDTWILNGQKRWIGNALVRPLHHLGARSCRQSGEGIHRREQVDARFQRREGDDVSHVR